MKKNEATTIFHFLSNEHTVYTRVLLTFVETSSDVSSWSSQENPENHSAGHQSPTIGWREEPQAGENYKPQRHSLSIATRNIEDSSIIELITRSLQCLKLQASSVYLGDVLVSSWRSRMFSVQLPQPNLQAQLK